MALAHNIFIHDKLQKLVSSHDLKWPQQYTWNWGHKLFSKLDLFVSAGKWKFSSKYLEQNIHIYINSSTVSTHLCKQYK